VPQKSEAELLRDSMTREVSNDSYAIAQQLFGQGQQPDVARLSNQQIDDRYFQAVQSGDRDYLQSEATRDPRQFLESMQRLHDAGRIMVPADQALEPQPPLPKPAQAAAPVPQPPPQTLQSAQAVPTDQVPSLLTPPGPTPQLPILPMPASPAPTVPLPQSTS
jgi:hypothetical protein